MERLSHAIKHAAKLKLKREKTGHGFIYIIQCHDFVKVGLAIDVEVRLCQLQTGCPYELYLLKSFATQSMERDEQRLHELWKRYEIRGEWFQVPAGELAFVINADCFEDIFAVV